MLKLYNVKIEPLNVKKKSKGIIKYDKRTITYNVETAQCDDGTVKRKKKNKGTIECDKIIVICDVGTAQCEDRTVKHEKKVR